MGLQQKLENFTLNEDTRKKLLSGSKDAPVEFEDIARIALAGYFLVTSGKKGIKVYPTCVEFYYHEEEKMASRIRLYTIKILRMPERTSRSSLLDF